jgi:hypothetical protein
MLTLLVTFSVAADRLGEILGTNWNW